MTREEEIYDAADRYSDVYKYNEDVDYMSIRIAFRDGAEWADKHPKSPWISTENELPTKGGHYLCMDENHHISALAFRGNRWVNSSAFFDVSLDVVKYWMLIPNLPKE